MHELGIMTNVLEIAIEYAEQNNVKKIRAINLTAGVLSNIVPSYAQKFFNYISKGTIAENAVINIRKTPAIVVCRSCGVESEVETHSLSISCTECGAKGIQIITGKEFRVASIEVE